MSRFALGWRRLLTAGICSGILLQMPAIWLLSTNSKVTSLDAAQALKRIAAAPLERMGAEVTSHLALTIPDDPVSRRVLAAWGDPGYVLAVTDLNGRNLLGCLGALRLSIHIMEDGRTVETASTSEPPYGYSVACRQYGLAFGARPAAKLSIVVSGQSNAELNTTEVIIVRYWRSTMKDRLISIDINRSLHRIGTVIGVVGLGLLLVSGAIVLWVEMALFKPVGRFKNGTGGQPEKTKNSL